MKLLVGSSNQSLGKNLATIAKLDYVHTVTSTFADGELIVQLEEDLAGHDVLVMQSISYPANDNLMELLLLIDTAKRMQAKTVTAVIPYFGYARQDRVTCQGSSVSAQLVAKVLEVAGVERIITIDLHSPEIEKFFTIPVHNLEITGLFAPLISGVVVSPDRGGVSRAQKISSLIGADLVVLDKQRQNDYCKISLVSGEVAGKACVLVDDIVDTANTIVAAAEFLMQQGAKSVEAFATHAVLSNKAIERLEDSALSKLYITNTIERFKDCILPAKFQLISVELLLAQSIVFDK